MNRPGTYPVQKKVRRVKRAIYGVLHGAQLPRLLRFRTRGAIFMLHRVVPAQSDQEFSPNRQFAVTPENLHAILDCLQNLDYDVVDLDEAWNRLRSPEASRRFACLTFDDGYRDNLELAYPLFAARGVPMTTYVTTGFIDRTDPAWWFGLEACVQQGVGLTLPQALGGETLPTGSLAEQHHAFDLAARWMQRASREARRDWVRALHERHGVDGVAQTDALFMNWDELEAFSRLPGVTLGAHTISHPALNALTEAALRDEIGGSKAVLERRLGRSVRHFAYPYGDATTTGSREFAAAAACGFVTATTTRHDALRRRDAGAPFALPRLPTDPFEDRRSVAVKLSGLAGTLQALRRGTRPPEHQESAGDG